MRASCGYGRQRASRWLAFSALPEQPSPRPQALYSAADLYNELSRITFTKSDLHKTLTVDLQLAKTYPDDKLADDAL